MTTDDVRQIKEQLRDLSTKIEAVNHRIQIWSDSDYKWKKDEMQKRESLEMKIQPIVTFFDDWARTKKMIMWLIGGISAAIALFLLLHQAFMVFIKDIVKPLILK